MTKKMVPLTFVFLFSVSSFAFGADNRVTPKEFIVDPPTLINLGFEWFVEGDDNRNATVEARYRPKGQTAWKSALPLLRLHGEEIYNGAQLDVISPNMFAGSILDLEPDTEYECSFHMSDPDGGEATQTVTVRTRPERRRSKAAGSFMYTHTDTKARRQNRHSRDSCARTT